MSTVYVLLVLAVMVFAVLVLYFTRAPSAEQLAASELKVPVPKPAIGVTRTQPEELPPIDYSNAMAPATNQGDSARARIAIKRAAKQA